MFSVVRPVTDIGAKESNCGHGTYVNVIATTFAAFVGPSSLPPIMGVGHSSTPWQEGTIGLGTFGRRTQIRSIEFSNICNSCAMLNAGSSKVLDAFGERSQ